MPGLYMKRSTGLKWVNFCIILSIATSIIVFWQKISRNKNISILIIKAHDENVNLTDC